MDKTSLILHKHKKTKTFAIVLVIICTLSMAFAQLMLKIGSKDLSFDVISLFSNIPLIIGAITYVISSFILIISLKYGELSILYPILALSYVWVNLLSSHFLGEQLNALKWGGIALILLGVSMIGWGSDR